MPQLRKDPIVSRWVIIATERARRAAAFVDPEPVSTDPAVCPYCKGNHAPVVYANQGVKVLMSAAPIFSAGQPFAPQQRGLYRSCPSYGGSELVLETPDHVANMADLSVTQIRNVFEAYAARMKHYYLDPAIKYVLPYKNYGAAAGSRNIGHSRSQIIATPVVPVRQEDKLNGAKLYFDFHDRSLFYDLVRQEQKQKERIVLETDRFIAVCPFAARFPFETWVLPKPPHQHSDFALGIKGLETELADVMKQVLTKFKVGLNDPAYNFMLQSSPSRMETQDSYCWHIEILPRLTRVAGFERGTGFYINPLPPEMTAEFLREVRS